MTIIFPDHSEAVTLSNHFCSCVICANVDILDGTYSFMQKKPQINKKTPNLTQLWKKAGDLRYNFMLHTYHWLYQANVLLRIRTISGF